MSLVYLEHLKTALAAVRVNLKKHQADLETLDDAVNNLQENKVAIPKDADENPTNGSSGQILMTNGDGTTSWETMTIRPITELAKYSTTFEKTDAGEYRIFMTSKTVVGAENIAFQGDGSKLYLFITTLGGSLGYNATITLDSSQFLSIHKTDNIMEITTSDGSVVQVTFTNEEMDTVAQSYFHYNVCDADVLTRTNTTEYTPTEDYHPSTKKYVDDLFNSVINGSEVAW